MGDKVRLSDVLFIDDNAYLYGIGCEGNLESQMEALTRHYEQCPLTLGHAFVTHSILLEEGERRRNEKLDQERERRLKDAANMLRVQ